MSTDHRRFVISFRDGSTDTIEARDRHAAVWKVTQKLQAADPRLTVIEAKALIKLVSVHPEDRRPRGPKPGTPNPYYKRYPGELSPKEQRRRKIDPATARRAPPKR